MSAADADQHIDLAFGPGSGDRCGEVACGEQLDSSTRLANFGDELFVPAGRGKGELSEGFALLRDTKPHSFRDRFRFGSDPVVARRKSVGNHWTKRLRR